MLGDTDSQGDLAPGTTYANTNTLSFTLTGNVSHGILTLNGVQIGIGARVTAAQLAPGC